MPAGPCSYQSWRRWYKWSAAPQEIVPSRNLQACWVLGCIVSPLMQFSPWPTTAPRHPPLLQDSGAHNHPSLPPPSPLVASVAGVHGSTAERSPPPFRKARIGRGDRSGLHVAQPTLYARPRTTQFSPTRSPARIGAPTEASATGCRHQTKCLILVDVVSHIIAPTSSTGTVAIRTKHAGAVVE